MQWKKTADKPPSAVSFLGEIMLTDLGKVLRGFRVLTGNSLYGMSKQIDMGSTELSGIEFGRTQPSDEQLNKIACYLAGKEYESNPYNPNKFEEFMNKILEESKR